MRRLMNRLKKPLALLLALIFLLTSISFILPAFVR